MMGEFFSSGIVKDLCGDQANTVFCTSVWVLPNVDDLNIENTSLLLFDLFEYRGHLLAGDTLPGPEIN